MTTPKAAALVLLLASPVFCATAPSPQRRLHERQIDERLALVSQQQADLRRARVGLDDEEAAFRRRLGTDRDAFDRQERWNLKLFDESLRGAPRLQAKEARRAFSDKQRGERKTFDAAERQRRLQFYAEQRAKLKRIRALEAEQKRQLEIDQRGAREIQALR